LKLSFDTDRYWLFADSKFWLYKSTTVRFHKRYTINKTIYIIHTIESRSSEKKAPVLDIRLPSFIYRLLIIIYQHVWIL